MVVKDMYVMRNQTKFAGGRAMDVHHLPRSKGPQGKGRTERKTPRRTGTYTPFEGYALRCAPSVLGGARWSAQGRLVL
jgi:hypothetical protein